MTQRDRPASGGVSVTRRLPAGQQQSPRDGPASAPAATPLWEALYRCASPAQQQELLSLASHQGVVYAHQLPAGSNGAALPPDRSRELLAQILSGKTDDLEIVPAECGPISDEALDPDQRLAVARALQ